MTDAMTAFQNRLIGWDNFFDHFQKNLTIENKYPPHNLIKYNDGHSVIEMALAGFSESDIDISLKDNVLTVSSVSPDEIDKVYDPISEMEELFTGEEKEPSPTFIHRGIARRSFKKSFHLHEHIVVKDAMMLNGMLRIILHYEVPEDKKPVTIPIRGRDGPQVLMEKKG